MSTSSVFNDLLKASTTALSKGVPPRLMLIKSKTNSQKSTVDKGSFGLTFTYEIENEGLYSIEITIKITPMKSSVKLKSANALVLNNNDVNMPREVCIEVLKSEGASISQVTLVNCTDLFVLEQAYGDRYMLYFSEENSAFPKRYKLKFAVTFDSCKSMPYITIPLIVSGE